MKSYPSIPDNYADFYGRKCLAQVKYDGSNLRFLWTKKNGWCRYGTRTRLFDSTDELYGQALPIFERKYKEQLTWIIRNNKEFDHAKEVIAFAEFFGPSSFAGEHRMDEPKDLKLFDVNIGTRGFMSPFVFRATFKHLDIAETLYEGILDDVFAKRIRHGLEPRTFEGTIVKGGELAHKLWMVKIKSMKYLEKLGEYENSKR